MCTPARAARCVHPLRDKGNDRMHSNVNPFLALMYRMASNMFIEQFSLSTDLHVPPGLYQNLEPLHRTHSHPYSKLLVDECRCRVHALNEAGTADILQEGGHKRGHKRGQKKGRKRGHASGETCY